jgi:hypothetical protein
MHAPRAHAQGGLPLLPTKFNFLNHVRCLRLAARAIDAEVLMAFDSLAAYVRRGDRHWMLHPQFMIGAEGGVRYARRPPDEDATLFIGWRPYAGRTWPATPDKLIVKRAAEQAGLAVPPWATEDAAAQALGDVIVKRNVGSFGEHVHGPYRSTLARPLAVAEGEYYERFIAGTMLKIWYLNDRAVAVERDRLSAVTGDGVSSLRQLVERRLERRIATIPTARERLLERAAQFAAYDGRGLDDVLADRQTQHIEFRFGSDLGTGGGARDIFDPTEDGEEWRAVHDAGPAFFGMIPQPMRDSSLYAVDAVQDNQGTIWYLEMNSNPVVHPLAYRAMLEALVAQPASSDAQAATP